MDVRRQFTQWLDIRRIIEIDRKGREGAERTINLARPLDVMLFIYSQTKIRGTIYCIGALANNSVHAVLIGK